MNVMDSFPAISVIIPTYNRYVWLHDCLMALAAQTCSFDSFEVIVVDDGSKDDTAQIVSEKFPFKLRYLRQTNQGDAAARNHGANNSRSDLLVFLDDDIIVWPGYLINIVKELSESPRRIVVGKEILWLEKENPFSQHSTTDLIHDVNEDSIEIPFVEVCSNNMAIRRDDYFEVGLMDALGFSGSSIWCDVDFCYRASNLGFSFWQNNQAVCWHRDYVALSLDNRKKRMREVAFRAATLFDKYPELKSHLPMFSDMVPIKWGEDSPRRVFRKVARSVSSSWPVLPALEGVAKVTSPTSNFSQHIERWIVGAQIFHGYRDGLYHLQTRIN